MQHEVDKLKIHLDYYIEKDPNDKRAVMKAILAWQKYRLFLTAIVKIFQSLSDIYVISKIQSFMEFVELETYTDE